jgi:hypothetical protein
MIAYLVLLIAILSRVVPHPEMLNFTAVGAGLLYFGARRSRWQIGIAVLALAATDFYLTVYSYGYKFQVQDYLITWAWYAAVALLGSALLRKVTVLRVAAGVLTSATSFFLITNFMVWPGNPMYAQNLHGVMDCLYAGLPFYGRDLASTAICATVFFGMKPAAAWMSEHFHNNQTAA